MIWCTRLPDQIRHRVFGVAPMVPHAAGKPLNEAHCPLLKGSHGQQPRVRSQFRLVENQRHRLAVYGLPLPAPKLPNFFPRVPWLIFVHKPVD